MCACLDFKELSKYYRQGNSVDPAVLLAIVLGRVGCLNHVSLRKITKLKPTQIHLRVYKRRKFALLSFSKNINSSAHTLLQYSVAKVKFVQDKLWFWKKKFKN